MRGSRDYQEDKRMKQLVNHLPGAHTPFNQDCKTLSGMLIADR